MNYNEETLFLLSELEAFGLDRDKVERELSYSPNYIGQLLSRQCNEKVVTALKMLLKIKLLEAELGRSAPIPESRNKAEDFGKIVDLLEKINSNLNETKHHEVINQSLIKTSLLQSAKVEAIVSKGDYGKIVEELDEEIASSFLQTFRNPSQNNRYCQPGQVG